MATEKLLLAVHDDFDPRSTIPSAVRRWQILIAVSFVMAASLGLLSLLLTLLSSLGIVTNRIITGQTEAGLLVTVFVLLITAAHGLDRVNELRMRAAKEL